MRLQMRRHVFPKRLLGTSGPIRSSHTTCIIDHPPYNSSRERISGKFPWQRISGGRAASPFSLR
jgi:hypothetical protein